MTIRMPLILSLLTCLLFTSCNMTSPETYFDEAVLNCNMITGISGDGLIREMETPSVKMKEGSNTETVPIPRKEMLDLRIQYMEKNLEKLRKLQQTADTKEMIQTSIALHEYVLPIYKNEYTELSRMYDEGAPRDQIVSKAQAIHDKYNTKFEELFEKLTTLGKSYAKKHNISVKWGS